MPASDEVLNLATLMDELLERVVNGFEANGVDLPERRYWMVNQPAADCEQLVISFMQAYVGPVGDEANDPQHCTAPRTAQIDIQILRCAPAPQKNGKPPTPEKLQESARRRVIDAYTLLEIASSLDTWDEAMGPGMGTGMGVIATVDGNEVDGDFQGVTLHLTTVIP